MRNKVIKTFGRIACVFLALTIFISYMLSDVQCIVSADSSIVGRTVLSDRRDVVEKQTEEKSDNLAEESALLEYLLKPSEDVPAGDAAENLPIPKEAVVPTESNDARYQYILGTDYEPFTMSHAPNGYTNGGLAVRNMRTITLPVWKLDSRGEKYSSTYTIKIHKNLYESVKAIFQEIYELDIQFPVKYMVGYDYRKVGGVGLLNCPFMSIHTFGCAIDINPGDFDNDYYLGKGNDLRDKTNPYCIPDEVIEIFKRYGWFWGGDFDICADTMHFQYFELGFLQYSNDEPFPVLEMGQANDKSCTKNLTERLAELEYLETPTDIFTEEVHEAVCSFQSDYGLEASGKVEYSTWEKLINLTHYMDFVF